MKPEKGLRDTIARWDDALANNNLAEMEKYMSADWVIVGTGGGITSREDFLASIKSGDVVHSRMTTDETRIKVYGDTAVVIARGISEGTYKGQFFSLHEWSANVFIWKDGGWVCVSTMLTPV